MALPKSMGNRDFVEACNARSNFLVQNLTGERVGDQLRFPNVHNACR